VRGVVPRIFFDDFLFIFEKKTLNSWKYRISKKTGPYVTGMTGYLRPSRREVKNDVS